MRPRNVAIVTARELAAYFTTPLAYVFIVVFLALSGALTFYVGGFFERGEADLQAFFVFHPWLHLFFAPAIAMRLWAEERRTGTIELLMTLPLTSFEAVLGKFLAAWLFVGLALVLTFPMWLTVAWLGTPDHGVILASYLGSWILAGAFLAVGATVSALTRNQVIAFVLGAAVGFLFMMSGVDLVLAPLRGLVSPDVLDLVASFSFLRHFTDITRGVVTLSDLVFFGAVIGVGLLLNTLVIELEKA